MQKAAPSWGKAIGIIMICLGCLGVFYQIYKIMVPGMLKLVPKFNQFPGYNEHMTTNEEIAFEQINSMLSASDSEANLVITLGYLGLVLMVLYIIAGAKLLNAKPANYNFAKYTLGGLIVYNGVGLLLFVGFLSNLFLGMILTYAMVGLVFDIALFIILLASNKGAYGIGVDTSMQGYTLDTDDQEIL